MYALALLLFLGALVYRHGRISEHEMIVIPRRLGDRLTKLWEIAHHGMRENRLLRAEKALLTILKIDEKNAAAYNRLGILYAKQREYKDAIDCFEIASSIEPSASSLHNLGLIYYETENYQKAGTAFEQALKLEDNLAARHIAYAKVQEKLGNDKLMLQELDKAAELEPNPETYKLLASAYESRGMSEEAGEIQKKLNKLVLPAGKPRRILRPKRVVI
ncbi:tetratricopeptide repeat protein [Candidatus Saccharibacteria bacterium]|jgi:tetratricopeptide (TPR) repeat protein|nr:tetratricopeptide repeat protein [Candidatus Saccharibacteria bacterium]